VLGYVVSKHVVLEGMAAPEPGARDLVTGVKDEVAEPTRDGYLCLKNTTVRCLLNEALESSKAVFKP